MPHNPRPRTVRSVSVAVAAATATAALTLTAAPAGAVTTTPAKPLRVHTILNGKAHHWSKPDDLAAGDGALFTAFQNGVPSTGGKAGTPTNSTIVEFTLRGKILHTWSIRGKCDGLGVNPATGDVIATVNEDGNSSLWRIPVRTHGAPVNYQFDAKPMPHGGGTDAVVFDHGKMYLTASAPTGSGPAVYRVTLGAGHVAHLAAAPFYDSSWASTANPGGTGGYLSLTDPDSATVVPGRVSRFGGDYMLNSQGDQQLIFARHFDGPRQSLSVLNLTQSVDDVAFTASRRGELVAADASADTIDVISGPLAAGAAYTAVTPSGANTPPVPTPNNYLGLIDLRTGKVSKVSTSGAALQPHSLIYLRH